MPPEIPKNIVRQVCKKSKCRDSATKCYGKGRVGYRSFENQRHYFGLLKFFANPLRTLRTLHIPCSNHGFFV